MISENRAEPGRRKRRLLTPQEKCEIFLEVTSQGLTQADAARKWGVDASGDQAAA
jgi:transposase-like protein